MLKNKMLLSIVLVGLVLNGGYANSKTYSEEELGVRKSDLYEERIELKDKLEYPDIAPGESKLIERSFENAPPLISHSVEGLLPITKDYNSCLGCHAPEIASMIDSISVPKSHLLSYRPVVKMKGDKVIRDGKAYANSSDLLTVSHERAGVSSDRYNCSQCHVAQTDNAPLVKNNFSPEFRGEDGAAKSNLADILNEGVSYGK